MKELYTGNIFGIKVIRNVAFFMACFVISCFAQGQSKRRADSLYNVLKTTKYDTVKVNSLLALASYAEDDANYAKADSLAGEELELSERIHYRVGIAYGYVYLGLDAYYEGNYAHAVEEYFRALKIDEKAGDKRGQGIILNNIGLSYNMMLDYKHALQYYIMGLQIKQQLGDKRGTASSFNNIGMVYFSQHNYDSSLAYYNKSLTIKSSYKDNRGMASTYNNIGDVYNAEGKYDTALFFMQKALAIKQSFDDKYGIISSYLSIGGVYLEQGKYDDALKAAQVAVKMCNEIGSLDELKDAEKLMSSVYEMKKDGMNALAHYKDYIKARDSIYNRQNTQKTIQAEMNFQFEKKQGEAKAAQAQKDAIQKEQARKQQIIIYFISGILLLVFGFAIFAYRNYLQKQKANEELDDKNKKIEGAYKIIEYKNREITDSITYAKRIQRAMLPAKEDIKQFLPHSFVLFKPKAIVSGDFYFYLPPRQKEGMMMSVLAVADCTGHGVPGAFMSMIGSEKLRDAAEQSDDTGVMLKTLNRGIKASLHQSAETNSTRDGMDIALCTISVPAQVKIDESEGSPLTAHNGALVRFSGANRPLWIIRNGKKEIEEIKPDKMAIGGFTAEEEVFITHTIGLNKGDSFYMFSDGYSDQFGGPEGKKLTTKKFRELLLSLCEEPMVEQKKELGIFIEKWKGEVEQLDDILVIGVRI